MAAKHRITVNLEDAEYKALVDIAARCDRSMAWVGRKAIVQFIASQEKEEIPLFAGTGVGGGLFGKPV